MLPELIVIAVLLVAVAVVLALPASVEIGMRWRDLSFRFQVNLLFCGRCRRRIFPGKRKAGNHAKPSTSRKDRSIGPFQRFFRNTADSGRLLFPLLRQLARHVRISHVTLSGKYSLNDPAWTGWMAGLFAVAGTAAGPGALDRLRPDFGGNPSDVAVTAELRVRPVSVILISIMYLVRFLQQHYGHRRRERRW